MSADSALEVDVVVHRAEGQDGRRFSVEVAFTAEPGITILFGPSGCGKSTTLAAISGLVRPSRGRVALGGEVWFDSTKGIDRPVHTRGVAFVFQSLALFPHLTAVGNVAYGMERSLSGDAKRKRALELLEHLRVVHLADRKPPTFSGGEAQRVALARAFAMSPKVILLDEPFSAMDRQLRKDLVLDLRAMVDKLRVPLVHVTHQRNEARALGDRVVLLEKGRVTKTGAVKDLLPPQSPEALRDMSFDETPLIDEVKKALLE